MAPRSKDERGPLQGFVTERDLQLAEQEFPGITGFYLQQRTQSQCCPRTFLELLGQYGAFSTAAASLHDSPRATPRA